MGTVNVVPVFLFVFFDKHQKQAHGRSVSSEGFFASMPNLDRRQSRVEVVQTLNSLAGASGLAAVKSRPSQEEVAALFAQLCQKVSCQSAGFRTDLLSAAESWTANGGCRLDMSRLAEPEAGEPEDVEAVEGQRPLPGHAVHLAGAKDFRLRSRAFMLTFNALCFLASPDLRAAFQLWVEDPTSGCK